MSWNGVLWFLLLNGFLVVLVAGKSIPRVVDKDVSESGPVDDDDDQEERINPFNLEETYDGSFQSYSFNGSWVTDTLLLYIDRNTGDVYEFDVVTQERRLLLDIGIASTLEEPMIFFSYDYSHVLLGYDITAGFRHSTFKKFIVYNTGSKTLQKIANDTHIPLAKWSPTSNSLVYVLDNDIYYQTFTADGGEVRRITYNGKPGIVYNGVPDWVYEEEVLASGTALWFSPDGKHLAFGTFNDTGVRDAMILYYGKPGSLDDQYPTETKIKYPKAGTPSPIVSLSVVDLTNPSSKLVNLEPPTDIIGVDNILYTVDWWRSNRLVVTWTNRVQNKAQLVLYDPLGAAKNILYQEEPEGWLRVSSPAYHKQYAIILKPQDSGTDAGKFLHATRFEYDGEKLTNETDLTPDAPEVQSIVAIDHVRERVYYIASGIGEPSQRHLYSVPLHGTGRSVCISCEVRTPEGNLCTYASASFSADRSFYALTCSGPDPTFVTMFDSAYRSQYTWEDNKKLRKRLSSRTKPSIKDLYINANGYNSKVRLLLPPDFDEKKSYPLLINVYAGPNTVRITDEATWGYQSYMTTNRSVIYGYIDGRGSAYKGSKMLFEIYRRMGTVEVQDQITVTEALQRTYPWIDSNRTGIWGWSYGGFTTAMVLATDKKSIFKCGISVAPVTSWIYYDSIYTERFMGLPIPEDNLRGYNATDVTRKVKGIRGKKYMLIHGTGDDNVHYQQSMALGRALEENDILFEQLSYTDAAHSLIGVHPHLYHSMDRFWSNCFDLPYAH